MGRCVLRRKKWLGFEEAAGNDISIVGVRIREPEALPQRPESGAAGVGKHPKRAQRPSLDTRLDSAHSDLPMLKDILALTKLNYNTCIFGDGMPITLKFADAVGEILTAGPIKEVPPLPFGHYI
jgi:hypothetical protein